MTSTPRVVLLMHPFAGYDRGLLEGIARYAQLHGPWVFCVAGEHRGVPMPESDSTSDKLFPGSVRWHSRAEPLSLRRLDAAVRFIRDHCREAIAVSDVVAESHISRRSLEIRFQQILGRSIRRQIQQARLAWSRRLLVETNLSAEKIARACGFSSLSYMSSVFHRELGATLTDYRRQSRNP